MDEDQHVDPDLGVTSDGHHDELDADRARGARSRTVSRPWPPPTSVPTATGPALPPPPGRAASLAPIALLLVLRDLLAPGLALPTPSLPPSLTPYLLPLVLISCWSW